jgi:hypothetical protein
MVINRSDCGLTSVELELELSEVKLMHNPVVGQY